MGEYIGPEWPLRTPRTKLNAEMTWCCRVRVPRNKVPQGRNIARLIYFKKANFTELKSGGWYYNIGKDLPNGLPRLVPKSFVLAASLAMVNTRQSKQNKLSEMQRAGATIFPDPIAVEKDKLNDQSLWFIKAPIEPQMECAATFNRLPVIITGQVLVFPQTTLMGLTYIIKKREQEVLGPDRRSS
jgi:hypothetical protein